MKKRLFNGKTGIILKDLLVRILETFETSANKTTLSFVTSHFDVFNMEFYCLKFVCF